MRSAPLLQASGPVGRSPIDLAQHGVAAAITVWPPRRVAAAFPSLACSARSPPSRRGSRRGCATVHLRDAVPAAQRQHSVDVAPEDLQHLRDARLAGDREAPEVRSSDQTGSGAERHRFDHVAAAPDAAVQQHRECGRRWRRPRPAGRGSRAGRYPAAAHHGRTRSRHRCRARPRGAPRSDAARPSRAAAPARCRAASRHPSSARSDRACSRDTRRARRCPSPRSRSWRT